MYKEKTQKIENLNNFLDKHLNLEKLKQNHLKQIFYKIAFTNLIKYKNNFAKNEKEIDVGKFEAYLQKVASFLEKLYFKDKLEEKYILELHKIIMEDLKLEKIQKIGLYRTSNMRFYEKNLEGKTVELSLGGGKFVKENFIKEIEKLNKNIEANPILAITEFVINSLIIHPFENGNGKVFWTLLDLLFLKYNYFPPFIMHENFRNKVHTDVFAYYATYKKKEPLNEKFLNLIIYIYSHYKM